MNFVKRMCDAYGVNYETFTHNLRIKMCWPMKGFHGCYIRRGGKHWIYAEGLDYHVVVHELTHALRRETNTNTSNRTEYDYDPEEYEALVWEMRYLRSVEKWSKRQIVNKMIKDTEYPREFINILYEFTN